MNNKLNNQLPFQLKAISFLVASCFVITPHTYAADTSGDPECSGNNAKLIGTVVGGLLGAYLGNQLGDGKAGAVVVGVALGGWLGNYIGSEIDRRHCELDKIAKANAVDIKTESFELKEDTSESARVDKETSSESASNESQTPISSGKVDLVRLPGAAQFASGSAILSDNAKHFFADIAAQYSAEKASEAALKASATGTKQQPKLSDNEKNRMRKQLVDEFNRRPIVLVGHTDDSGDSRLNQQLSEQRARTVAAYFKSKGIPESRIYFRGAGDSDPIADNRTEEGREANRRVEIIELESVEKLDNFIALKKENINFLRPKITTNAQTTPATKDNTQTASQVADNSKIHENSKPVAASENSKPITTGRATANTPATENNVSSEEAPKSNKQKTLTVQKDTPASNTTLDLGGEPSKSKIDAEVQSAMGKAVRPGKGIVISLGSWFVNEAQAEDSKVYDLPCTADAPRFSGKYLSLQTGQALESKTKTSEYAPGLYQTTWVGVVNGNYLGLSPVAVFRDNFQPASQPNLFIYANTTSPGKNAKPTLKVPMQVNIYPGEKGILYRMYSSDKSKLICADIVLPKHTPFVVAAGKLYYKHGSGTYEVAYAPEMLSLNK